jgi:hypothetical protein
VILYEFGKKKSSQDIWPSKTLFWKRKTTTKQKLSPQSPICFGSRF